MMSSRLPAHAEVNGRSHSIDCAVKACRLVDLTHSNPTRVGFPTRL